MGAPLILLTPVMVLLACIGISIILGILEDRRLRRLAAGRPGETICHFARSLDYRRLDTRVIRAVYEGLHRYLGRGWPVRASDDLDETYRIDRDDLDDLAIEIAGRCGRNLDGWERNPYYNRLYRK